MTDEEKAGVRQHYSDLLGKDVWEASWVRLQAAGYTESSIPYLAPELVHHFCGTELMKTWKEKIWKKYSLGKD